MKRKKRLLSVIMTLAMITTLFAGMTTSSGAYSATGTMTDLWNSGNPTSALSGTYYSISSAQEMVYLQNYTATSGMNTSGVTFFLTSSINFVTETYTGTWTGVGKSVISSASTNSPYEDTSNSSNLPIPFEGTLDGDGLTITVNRTVTTSGQGGVVNYLGSSGNVKNLTVAGSVTISSNVDAIGGVVGYSSGIINNVTSSVNVITTEYQTDHYYVTYNVGGIAGFNNGYYNTSGTALVSGTDIINGYILNCANEGNVTAYGKVGGITGENSGKINSCSNIGEIAGKMGGKNGVGGIAGRAGNNNTAVETSRIWSCYNQGNISDSDGKWVGGICGFKNLLSDCVNCYNTGGLSAYSYKDHIAGNVDRDNSKVVNCYGLNTISVDGYDGAILKTEAQMKVNTFARGVLGVGADARWNAGDGVNYPTLSKTAVVGDSAPSSMGSLVATVTTLPTKTTYNAGETLDLTGMVVKVSVNGGTAQTVTDYTTSPADGATLSTSNTSVTVSGEYNAQLYSVSFNIVVNDPHIVYLDVVSGNDGTAVVEDATHPYETLDAAVAAAGTGGTVYVKQTVPFTAAEIRNDNVTFKRYTATLGTTNAPFNINAGTGNTVRLTTMTLDGNDSGTLINVASGILDLRGNVKLKKCATGVNVVTGATAVVHKASITASENSVVSAGTFTLDDYGNTTITGPVSITAGTGSMNGGTITGFTKTAGNGGGLVVSGGTFTMNGGTITDNDVANGGGVYVNGGTFTMTNGTITGNTATNGGGVYVGSGTFTMTGGTISGNTATAGSGVYVNVSATFNYAGYGIDSGQVVYLANTSTSDCNVKLSSTLSAPLTVKCATVASNTRVVRTTSSYITSALNNTQYVDSSASISSTAIQSGNYYYVVLS
jgi:methionine-rich copper-binding protein CopC